MTKPKFIDGYEPQVTQDCERVLVTLLRGLGPLRDSVYLVGGLAPRYLVTARPPQVPPHAGTRDIDVVVDMALLADTDAYATLEKNLKTMGFERGENDAGVKTNWRWKARTESGAVLILEFLAYDPQVGGGRVTELPAAGKVSALNVPHADMVFDLHRKTRVTAERLDGGGVVTESVAYADPVCFVCLKAFAFDDRAEHKDAHDIVYCLEYLEGGVELAMGEFRQAAQGKHRDAVVEALRKLQSRFGDDDRSGGYLKDGPVSTSRFEIGDDPARHEDRLLRQRQVAALVQQLLDGLADLWRSEDELTRDPAPA